VETALSYCRECLIPAAPHLLFDGLCAECVPEHLDIPLEDRQYLDTVAIASCRAADLNAVERPCGFALCSDPRCHAEKTRYDERPRREYTRRTGAAFGPFDAADLERFYRTKLPPAAWDHSAFGAMLQKIGEATNPDSDERPARGTPWTEVVDVSASTHAGRFGSWEDQMAAYLDSRHRQMRVWRVLSRLPQWARDVLEARYGENSEAAASSKLGVLAPVALLTQTARFIRDSRAQAGDVEWVEHEEPDVDGKPKGGRTQRAPTTRGVLVEMAHRARSSTASAQERSSSAEALERIRREAEELLRQAESAFAREAAA
jgi:hypothetical protein